MADMREVRGKAIAEQGNQVKKVNDHSFKVKSQSGNGVYEIKATPNGMTCTCPDFVYRGGKCKHIAATRYYLEIEKDTSQGTVTEKVHLISVTSSRMICEDCQTRIKKSIGYICYSKLYTKI